jgi:hypothetical protein
MGCGRDGIVKWLLEVPKLSGRFAALTAYSTAIEAWGVHNTLSNIKEPETRLTIISLTIRLLESVLEISKFSKYHFTRSPGSHCSFRRASSTAWRPLMPSAVGSPLSLHQQVPIPSLVRAVDAQLL